MECVFLSKVSFCLVGPDMKFRGVFHPIVIAPARIPDLNVVERMSDGQ